MYLKSLLKKCGMDVIVINNHFVSKLANNSANCIKDAIFFAVKGYQTNGHLYIDDAIKNGAKTIVYEDDIIKNNYEINYLQVDDVKKYVALMAKYYYHNLSRKYKVIVATGTKGKSSVTTLLFDYLNYLSYKPLLIGTCGVFFNDEKTATKNTTPDILTIYELMKKYYQKGARHLIMEASSIAICEKRLAYLDIDVIIFTNLGQDHLDYHLSLADYKYAKGLLINQLSFNKKKAIILNKDDDYYLFYKNLSLNKTISYGIKRSSNYQGINLHNNLFFNSFIVKIRGIRYRIKTPFSGDFNIYNILAVMATIDFLKLSLFNFTKMLNLYLPIEGRMNIIKHQEKRFIIDFAHTKESIESILKTIKKYCENKLWVICGAGGNRDKNKRSSMGMACEKYADRIIFTNDNPRYEDPIEIIKDLISKLSSNKFMIILNRKDAIGYAIKNSSAKDIIVILGKGNEDYQEIKGVKYLYNDKDVLYNLLAKD